MNHSKGPWKLSFNGASTKVVDAEGKAVCMITPRKDAFNGHLIAAAPKMQKTILDLLSIVRGSGLSNEDIEHTFGKRYAAKVKSAFDLLRDIEEGNVR